MINNLCAGTFKKPTKEFKFNSKLKKIARDEVYINHHQTFYCGCDFEPSSTGSAGTIDPLKCGYITKNPNSNKGSDLEWEHVVPAAGFGQHRESWINHKNNEFCDLTSKSGRECSRKTNSEFTMMEADLHNLVPEIGELNGARGNKPFGLIPGEPREYGNCDFELSKGKNAVVEPADEIRGEVARTWLYMYAVYGAEALPTSEESLIIFCNWHKQDPVDEWEKIRNDRIAAIQGNSNPYIDNSYINCDVCGDIEYIILD